MVESAAKQGLSRPELWERIRVAELPGAVVWAGSPAKPTKVTFTARVQHEQNLTDLSAERLVAEYRRYLYLKTIDGGELTPSKRVDDTWHFHLAMGGGNAWKDFCNDVLGRPVEHRTGMTSDQAQASYAHTLENYRREFKEEPPNDIWPGNAEKQRAAEGALLASNSILVFLLGFILFCLGFESRDFWYYIGLLIIFISIYMFFKALKLSSGTDLATRCG
jgi:hypothetical protein